MCNLQKLNACGIKNFYAGGTVSLDLGWKIRETFLLEGIFWESLRINVS
jgi:hypothetical protein